MAKTKIEKFNENVSHQITGKYAPKTSGTKVAQLASLTKTPKKSPSVTPKNPSAQTTEQQAVAIKEVLDGYACGKTRRTLIKELVAAGYTERHADKIMRKVAEDLTAEVEKKKTTLVTKNIAILEHIIETTISSRDFRTALTAIAELNKVLHAYETNIEVKIENNFGFDFGVPTLTAETQVQDEINTDIDEC